MIDLSGIWRLRCEARGIEVDYPVPGDVHSALIAAGIIPDPYKGKNELACRCDSARFKPARPPFDRNIPWLPQSFSVPRWS